MKKILAIMAVSALCFGLMAGCGDSVGDSSANGENESGFLIQSTVYTQEYYGKDGKKVIGTYHYELPEISAKSDDAVLQNAAEHFNQEVEELLENEIDYWDDTMENFPEEDAMFAANNAAWIHEVSYALSSLGDMISVEYNHYIYSGGAHGFTYYTQQMHDMKQGRAIELEDLTDDVAMFEKTVAAEILRQIEENRLVAEYGYWNDYADYVERWEEDGHGVYFSEDGSMRIVFGLYELAPYAAGPQEFVIGQDIYKSCMNDYGKVLLGIA